MFTEEVERLELKLRTEQEQRNAAERDKERIAGELRVAKHANGELTATLEDRDQEIQALRRKVQEAQQVIGNITLLEQRLNKANDDVLELTADLDATRERLATSDAAHELLLADTREQANELAALREEAEVTARLRSAIKERLKLDAVIDADSLKLGG